MRKFDLTATCSVLTAFIFASTFSVEVRAASVTAAWLFDEGGGTTITDSSGFNSSGTLVGDAEWTAGMFGSAMAFESGEYVDVGPPTPTVLLIDKDITIMAWVRPHEVLNNWQVILSMQRGSSNGEAYALTYGRNNDHLLSLFNTQGGNGRVEDPDPIAMDEWVHAASTYDGEKAVLFRNAQPVAEVTTGIRGILNHEDRKGRFAINGNYNSLNGGLAEHCSATIDEVLIFDEALTQEEISGFMEFGFLAAGKPRMTASRPDPSDGALLPATWASLSWTPGVGAVSHDVYIGTSFEDVDAGTADTFQGNQTETTLVIGFPGFPVPDGLIPGTTYYWRVDEVNDADPNSPWKGDIWSFLVPPKTAYYPDPIDGAELVDTGATLSWTGGYGAKLHTVYIGTDYDDVNNASGGSPQGATSYKPSALESEKVYYWRIDEFDGLATYKGDIWGFSTTDAAGSLEPANGATGAALTSMLTWTPAATAASHDVYFGTDKDAVNNATSASPEFKGNKASGSESYDPGKLAWHSDYYWRIDAVYNTGKVKGLVWSFTTADFLLVDDFESYNDIDPPDAASNRIFDSWIDGFGTTDNGALVGNDLPPYAEQTIVHGGSQSLIYRFDNNMKTSEATLTLVNRRDWTEEGVAKLSLWFRGMPANSAEPMFVALNGSAAVYHEDNTATQMGRWTQWVIDLQGFADQGVNLANVNTITIGIGTKGSPAAGGAGTMYFDDIRLIR